MRPYYEHAGVTIHHGDCREVLPGLAPVDLMLTDPPYGTRVEADGYGRRQNYGGTGRQIEGDENLDAFTDALGLASFGVLCAFASPKMALPVLLALQGAGLAIRASLVWDKLIPGLGGLLRYQHENIYVASRGEFASHGPLFSVLREPSLRGGPHPHEKPTALLGALLAYCGGETLVDPFAGVGSTLRAAKDRGVRAIGIEIEERYCEIAAKRLEQEVLPLTANPCA